MFELTTREQEETIKLNSDSIYANAKDNPEFEEKVLISFVDENTKLRESGKYEIPKPKNYDLTLTEDLSEEISKIPNVQPVYIHPNDPKLDIVQKPVQQNYYNGFRPPIMNHNPVAAVQQSELYRQQQAQRYVMGQQYIANRGPLNYSFNNPNGIPNLRRFQDDMNNIINDPSKVIDAVKPIKNDGGEQFVRVNGESREEYNDKNYERDAKERQEMAESLKKSSFGNPNANQDNSFIPPRQHLSYAELKQRMNNQNTPETNLSNFKTKSGDQLLHISSNSAFTANEVQNAYAKANAEYEAQKKAILSKQPLVYSSSGQQVPRFYNPNDYNKFISTTNPSRPKYYSGYGYMSVIGAPDENGLPTVWYDDQGKYLTPTKLDIEEERVPLVITNRTNKDLVVPEKKKEESPRTKLVFVTRRSVIDEEDGLEYTETHYSDSGETKKELKSDDSIYDSYSDMGKNAIDQFKKDDTILTTIELSRYNVELADLFCWLKNVVDLKTFILLKRECQDQLRTYRDNDPLCLYKSTVIIAGDTTIILKPKPVEESELQDKIAGLKPIDQAKNKLDIIYMRYLTDLNKATSLEDKLKIIRSARDIEVVKRSDDKALKKAKEIFDKLEPVKKSNFERYRFWKSIYRAKYMDEGRIDRLEVDYANWWNKPRESMSQNEYDVKYSNRMSRLMEQKLTEVKKLQYMGNITVLRNSVLAAKEWERLSEGRFNKENMTLDDYLVAMNVTNYNIEKERIMKRRIDNIRNGKTDTKAFEHSILDKIVDKNVSQLGLSQVMKLPRYAPVSLSGIDKTMDVETRRQRFIDRIFAMKGRPLI